MFGQGQGHQGGTYLGRSWNHGRVVIGPLQGINHNNNNRNHSKNEEKKGINSFLKGASYSHTATRRDTQKRGQ